MTEQDIQAAIRASAIEWLRRVTFDGQLHIGREQLAQDFMVNGERFPLVDRGRGIRKPAGWSAALSITTAALKSGRPRPYADDEGPDGLHRYKLRRDEGGEAENEGLREALRQQVPLIWFVGIAPSVFQAIFPVYLIAEEPELDQFVLALTEEQRQVTVGSPVEEMARRYIVAETKRRLHQRVFASQVMLAYSTQCAVCALGHRQLLDAAHIVPDVEADGVASVTNAMALCKIHHAAYDENILGIRPDYRIEIKHELLIEKDGPMLQHGLQEHHGRPLMRIPTQRSSRPDRVRLEERYERFLNAG